MNKREWYDTFNKLYTAKVSKQKQFIYPLYAGLKIIEKCNQHCKHCWAGKSRKKPYSLLEIKQAIQKLQQFNIYHLTITGGEPLLHPDWLEIVNFSKATIGTIELFTNGTLLTDENILKLSNIFEDCDFVQISLDGLEEKYKLQRQSNSFNQVIENIKKLVANQINVRLNMTITHFNIDDMVNVYKLASTLGVTAISFSPVYPLRKGKHLTSLVDYKKYEKLAHIIEKEHQKDVNNIQLSIIYPIEITSSYAKHTNPEYIKKLNTDLLHWTIDAEGNIFHFMDQYNIDNLYIGNLYTDSVEQLKKSGTEIQKHIAFFDTLNLKCETCSLKKACSGYTYKKSYSSIASDYERCGF